MRNIIITGWMLFASISFIPAQKYDFTWMLGYSGGRGNNDFGISYIDFNPDTTATVYADTSIAYTFDFTNNVISDAASGELLFYFNNIALFDITHDRMQDSGQFNETTDFILKQGAITLPHPKGNNHFVLINGKRAFFISPEIPVSMIETWYSEIDMNANNGFGAVTLKQESLITDTLSVGKITAVRHGNGRDWWVLIREYCQDGNCERESYYRILVTPEGWTSYKQTLLNFSFPPLDPTPAGSGQAVFTPDGTKYLTSNSVLVGKPNYLDIYDFNRCTGILSNRKRVETERMLDISDGGSGLAISSNSRFAYLILWKRVIQYDLWADDIQASAVVVAEYDGFEDIFPTRFLIGQLAPDGKIYICTTNSTRYLHVIHAPNEKGLACDLRQHDLRLPTFNSFSIPNYPNYRLYDFPDSPCDTLGINFDGTVTSTADFTEEESVISVYPNPAFDVVHIEVEQTQDLEIRLYSMLGELVTTQHDTVLDVHDLASGVYVVAVLSEGELIGSRKIIVQR